MNSSHKHNIQKLYEVIYPYGTFHNDYNRACTQIKAQLHDLCERRNLALLLVMARSVDIEVNERDDVNSLCRNMTSMVDNVCSEPTEKSLYDRLGGVYGIAAVVNRFSDALLSNPITGRDSPNQQLREWSRNKAATRLPGLKFLRTLWVCDITGGPYKFRRSENNDTSINKLNLERPHCPFKISSEIFDEVASELDKAMDYYKIPAKEKSEVLAAFAAHKDEVTFCFAK